MGFNVHNAKSSMIKTQSDLLTLIKSSVKLRDVVRDEKIIIIDRITAHLKRSAFHIDTCLELIEECRKTPQSPSSR